MLTQFNSEGDVLCLVCGEVAAEVRLCDNHLNRYHEWKQQIDDDTSINRVEEFVLECNDQHRVKHHAECAEGIEPNVECNCGAAVAQMNRTQLSFSTLWQGFATNADARTARDARYREEIAKGNKARRWVLKNQVRKYAGFGVEDGRSCDVFMLDISASQVPR